ncbi:hypothetical protein CHCC20375_1050 [Bacillus licheniformis]|nr:hypothetical protein CHCC20375_1050 [Bacillus licheniformis]
MLYFSSQSERKKREKAAGFGSFSTCIYLFLRIRSSDSF